MFIHRERTGLQAEIQRLQAENAKLLRGPFRRRHPENSPQLTTCFTENGELLRQTTNIHTTPTTIVALTGDNNEKQPLAQLEPKDALLRVLLAKVHHCQRFLVKEREAFAQREATFDQSIRALRGMVEQVVKTQHHHRGTTAGATAPPGRAHHSAPTSPTVRREEIRMNTGQVPAELVDRVMELTANLSQRAEEVKVRTPLGPQLLALTQNHQQIRLLAESKAAEAAQRVADLERKSEGLSLLYVVPSLPPPSLPYPSHADSPHSRAHNNQADFELNVLNLRLKRLEAATLEYVPLAEQDIILDFEAYRDELGKVRSRQKIRRKREERWGLWTSVGGG